MLQHNHPGAMNAAEPIIVAIHRRIELVVAAQRNELDDIALLDGCIDIGPLPSLPTASNLRSGRGDGVLAHAHLHRKHRNDAVRWGLSAAHAASGVPSTERGRT
jgi:hypothetical protein